MDPQVLFFLAFLAVFLTFVTLVGHGIWVLLAWVIRQLTGTPPEATTTTSRCAVCRAPLGPSATHCDLCGWSHVTPCILVPSEITKKHLERLQSRGLVDESTHHTVISALDKEKELLTQPAPSPDRAPAAPRPRTASPETPPAEEPEILEAEIVPTTDPFALPPTEPQPPAARPAGDARSPEKAPIARPTERRSPEDRVRQYAAQRQLAAERPAEPEEAPRQARPLGAFLAAFMEEKNIRWGELVGGLLIVSCSIALVVSFWSQIAERPLLKFGIFNGVTAILFAIGFYASRRWKLPTTSQGVLTTATLLVPLNFLAIAAFSEGTQATSLPAIVGEVVSVAGFAALVYWAGRIVAGTCPLALALGTIAPSVAQLLVRRLVDPTSHAAVLYAISATVVLIYIGVNAAMVGIVSRNPSLDERRANETFKLLGLTTFAALLPLGLLLFKTEQVATTLGYLAPVVSAVGIPALMCGLLLWRRAVGAEMSALRTAGTSVAVAGAAVLVGGIVAAWPLPATLVPTALAVFLVLTALALMFRIPEAHIGAAPCLALAYVLLCHAVTGELDWWVEGARDTVGAILSAQSGRLLLGQVVLYGAWSVLATRFGRVKDGLWLAIGGGAGAVGSLALITMFGFGVPGDPASATWVYAFYAGASLVGAVYWRKAIATWAGTALLLMAIVQAIVFRYDARWALDQPWIVALLVHATIVSIGAAVARSLLRPIRQLFLMPTSGWALTSATTAAMIIAWRMSAGAVSPQAPYVLWLSLIWLALAYVNCWPRLYTGFQVALTMALVLAVFARIETTDWYAPLKHGWCDPWSLQIHGISLALLSLGFVTVRLALRRFGIMPGRAPSSGWQRVITRLLYGKWISFDRLVMAGVVTLLLGLAIYGVVPGMAQELSPQTRARPVPVAGVESTSDVFSVARQVPSAEYFELAGIAHQHALQPGGWLLVGATLLVLGVGLWERLSYWKLGGGALAVASACLLLAGRWEPQVSVASALRWYTAATFGIGSVGLWFRQPVLRWARMGRLLPAQIDSPHVTRAALALLILITATPLVAMGALVSAAAMSLRPPEASQWLLIWWLMALFVLCATTGLILRFVDRRETNVLGARWAGLLAVGSWAPGTTRGSRGNDGEKGQPWLRHLSSLLLVLGAAPLVVVTLLVVAAALSRHPIVGPDPGSFFARIGHSASYALPILVIALSLVGHAVHQRSAGLALAAGLVLNVCATAAYLLAPAGIGQLPVVQWIRVAQVGAIVSGAYALLWLLALRRDRPTDPSHPWSGNMEAAVKRAPMGLEPRHPLITQVGLGVGFASLFVIPSFVVLFLEPGPPTWLHQAAGPWGGAGGLLTIAAGLALFRVQGKTVPVSGLGAALLATAALIALQTARWDLGNWLAYHTLLVTSFAAAWIILALGWLTHGQGWLVVKSRSNLARLPGSHNVSQWLAPHAAQTFDHRQAVSKWSVAMTSLVGALSLRSVAGDPSLPWWPVAGLCGASLLFVATACWGARRRYLYLAGLLLNIAASVWWLTQGQSWFGSPGPAGFFEFIQINVVALALPAVVWMRIDVRVISRGDPRPRRRSIGFHRVAAGTSLVLMCLVITLGLLADAASVPAAAPVRPSAWIGWLAMACTATGVVSCLWDRRARFAVAGLYMSGLAGLGLLTDQFNLPQDQLIWTGTMVLGAYGLGTSYLWSRRQGLVRLAAKLGMPPQADNETAGLGWLVPANSLLAVAVVALAFWAQLTFGEYAQRLSAAQAVFAQAFAVGLLARGRRQSQLRSTALWLGVVGAIAFGWSWLNPTLGNQLLNRAVVVAVALGAMAVLYGLGLTKLLRRDNQWTRASQRLVPTLIALALVSIVFVLTVEVTLFVWVGHVTITWPARVAVAVTLVGLAAACLVAALVPGRDPLGLNERQKTVYVYAAEGALALLFLHIRLTMPWLFTGFFLQYWPLIVMLIAYLGVGLGEWFRRRARMVLAEPLEKTGALLPMLPVLGYWMVPGQVHYSLVMLVAGVLYASLSVMRRSFGFGVLAALTANGGLWYLLYQTDGRGMLQHPQLWLIPPAVCVLVAAYLNRQRLSAEQMTSIRYLTSTVIYTSSTADVFLQGVAHAPWLPLILAGLSIAGIFAGILLQVRAFLYLGTSFLVLALTTVIWYAAVDLEQTWLWFVSGIVAGALIIALFAVFEKKRQEVLQLIEHMKEWEA